MARQVGSLEEYLAAQSAVAKGTTLTEVYEDYCEWCDEQSITPRALPSFTRDFTTLAGKPEKVAGRVRFHNIALRKNI